MLIVSVLVMLGERSPAVHNKVKVFRLLHVKCTVTEMCARNKSRVWLGCAPTMDRWLKMEIQIDGVKRE